MIRNLLLIIVSFFLCASSFAQDVHFTQYHASPFQINPAYTGWFKGNCRATANYRDQWRAIDGTPYSTVGLSFEKQHELYTEQINYGISLIQDNSGTVNLKSNMLTLSGSYKKVLMGHTFQGGVQIGLVNNSVNSGDFTFDSQFNYGEQDMFDPGIGSGEDIQQSKFYVDINAGVLWSKQLLANLTPVAGFAFYHLNDPNESLSGVNTKASNVPIRTVVHLGAEYEISEKLRVLPNVLFMNQLKAKEFVVGGLAEYDIKISLLETIYGGANFRYGMSSNYDAVAAIVGAKVSNFDIGLSYDINISSLQVATGKRGAFELSVRYICKSTRVKKVKASCDRM